MEQSINVRNQQRKPMIEDSKQGHKIGFMKKYISCQFIISIIRITILVLIYTLSEYTICYKEIWSILFYIIVFLIDIISLIGEINTYKFLKKQQIIVDRIQFQIRNMLPITDTPKACSYQSYLSIYQTIYAIKYKYNPTASTYAILRAAHMLTILVFGTFALSNQYLNCEGLLSKIILIFIMLTIFVSTYQMDTYLMDTSKGKYQHIGGLRNPVILQIITKFIRWRMFVVVNYSAVFLLILSQIILLVVSTNIQQISGLIIVISMLQFCLFLNILLQIYLITRAKKSEAIIISPKNLQLICSPYQLLYQLQADYKMSYSTIIITWRIMIFGLYICFSTYSEKLSNRDFWILTSVIIAAMCSEIIKFIFGHNIKINYISPIKFTLQKRIQLNCSICLNNYVDDSEAVELPCSGGHIFHSKCLINWTKSKQECPLCRYNLNQFLK